MVPNGHTVTYSFFGCIIRLGLFKKPLGFVRAVDLFLYKWRSQTQDRRNNGRKNRRKGKSNVPIKDAIHTKTHK